MNGRNYIIKKVLGYILSIIVVGGAAYASSSVLYNEMTNAISFAEDGVSTNATLLEYRPYKGKSTFHKYLVAYDKYEGIIELDSGNYPINGNVPVIYNKDNPKNVWRGHSGMSVWDLYKMNNHVFWDSIILLITLVMWIGLLIHIIVGLILISSEWI